MKRIIEDRRCLVRGEQDLQRVHEVGRKYDMGDRGIRDEILDQGDHGDDLDQGSLALGVLEGSAGRRIGLSIEDGPGRHTHLDGASESKSDGGVDEKPSSGTPQPIQIPATKSKGRTKPVPDRKVALRDRGGIGREGDQKIGFRLDFGDPGHHRFGPRLGDRFGVEANRGIIADRLEKVGGPAGCCGQQPAESFVVGGGLENLQPGQLRRILASRKISDIEREAILGTLDATRNNKTEAARRLGVTARTLSNKMKLWRQLGLVA